jgi:hypothetical protein
MSVFYQPVMYRPEAGREVCVGPRRVQILHGFGPLIHARNALPRPVVMPLVALGTLYGTAVVV